MKISTFIAWRYLFGRKSHSAVNAIAAVAVAGVAVATAALICVMAVFNGFHALLVERMDRMAPDVAVTPVSGKTISDGDSLAEALTRVEGVAIATPVVTDNALVIYRGHETPVSLKGVRPEQYRRMTALDSILLPGGEVLQQIDREGDPEDLWADVPPAPAAVSIGSASRTGLTSTGEVLTIFAPKRVGRVNIANPANSFVVDSLVATSVYEAQQSEFDENTIITDLETVRSLFMYDTEATAIEVVGKNGVDPTALADRIRDVTHGLYVVRDRVEQQTMSFRMVNVEKWMSFLLLAFILVIASFNIVSTLSMMVVDKEESMRTLRALGLSRRAVGGIFAWESVFVTMAGGVAGIILGCALCLAQQQWGFIRLSGDVSQMIVSAYPVQLKLSDVVATLIPLSVVGVACAAVAGAFARARLPK